VDGAAVVKTSGSFRGQAKRKEKASMAESEKDAKATVKDETIEAKLDKLLAMFKAEKSELIPILQRAQQEFGYLSRDVMRRISHFTHVPESFVYGVATFYAQFKFVPVGRSIIRVCRGTACYIKGSPRVLEEMEKQLGIKAGETTPDMEYTLETVACIGACALAPTMTIDGETYGKMTTKKVAEVLGDRRKAS
jgi:NADH-quinone oxidoreductase subunit E